MGRYLQVLRARVFCIFILFAVLPARVSAELQIGLELQHDGQTRSYDLYVPDQSGNGPPPLVLDLHGFNGSAALHRLGSGFESLAQAENIFVAWPNGLNARWNAEFGAAGTDDTGFLLSLVEHLLDQYDLDETRIYATGFSQGGIMVYRLACEASELFAAVVAVAGGVVEGSEQNCQGLRGVPTVSYRGDTDLIVPYSGGEVRVVMPPISVLSANDTLDYWRQQNGCSGPLEREILGPVSFCDTDANCTGGATVSMCTLRGSSPPNFHSLYNNEDNVDLARHAWTFMSEHANDGSGGGFEINAGITDAWFFPDTAGQGFFIIVLPVVELVFLSWFTYDTERPPEEISAILGEPGHRWLTAQGPFAGDTALLDVFVTQGGVFDSAEPAPASAMDGTIELLFSDCSNGVVNYNIPSIGRTSSIPIKRIVNANVPRCEALAGN